MTDLAKDPQRRQVLRAVTGSAAAGAAVVGLAACGSSSGTSDAGSASDTGSTGGSDSTSETSDSGTIGGSGPGTSTSASGVSIPASKVPVGGGYIDSSAKVVVTQPTSGSYKAFSAICTHEGCPVTKVSDGVITCPCHGSEFSAADGSVKGGPAQSALPAKKVTVSGSDLVIS